MAFRFLKPKELQVLHKENSRWGLQLGMGIPEEAFNMPQREGGSFEQLEEEWLLPVCDSSSHIRTLLIHFLMLITRLARWEAQIGGKETKGIYPLPPSPLAGFSPRMGLTVVTKLLNF